MDVEKFFKECLVNMGYITFEIAKKLKEKDYPFNTSHHYDKDGNIIVALCDYDERCEYPMPEIYQVLEWLRKDKKIHIGIIFTGKDYTAWIQPLNDIDTQITIHDCDSNNEAAIAGIKYILNNLI